MSESEKPEGDFSDSDAVERGEDGELRARMETLEKSGSGHEEDDSLEESNE